MIREFEGKTEEEAIQLACSQLGITPDQINIEEVEEVKASFIFGKSKVKIRVHCDDEHDEIKKHDTDDDGEYVSDIVGFLSTLLQKMNMNGDVHILSRDRGRLLLDIRSKFSGILIGKKGKTLDSLQLLVNVYAGKIGKTKALKVIVDTEDYRARRERSLISYAQKIAHQVRRTHSSMLLDAMNPFERRLVHTTLGKLDDVETVSEGDGMYKKIRIRYKGNR
ncbi:MAG: protein jag [Spirochaetales bacterium]|nr:protein jag [Spirochaetales bacterium]